MGLFDTMMGRTPHLSPEAASGGIPVNAQQGWLTGRDTSKGMFSGQPIQQGGRAPPAPSFKPAPTTPFQNNVGGQQGGGAQLMPDSQMTPPTQQMGGGMQSPMMMQALMQRMQRGGMQ